MKAGDVALLNMVQPDGTKKTRPILLLKQVAPFNDWIICAVSTQLQQEVKGFDHVLPDSEAGFAATGLKQSSLIRLGMLSTVSKSVIPGVIGSIPVSILQTLKKRLAVHIAG